MRGGPTFLRTYLSYNLLLQFWYAEVASRNENVDRFRFAEDGEADVDYIYF